MYTMLVPIVGFVLMLVAIFIESDPMAVHTNSNPPNPTAEIHSVRIIQSAAAPSARATYVSPTPTPSPEPTATPAPVGRVYAASETIAEITLPDIRALICSYDWDCPTALSIAHCESRYHPDSTNGIMLGLFQISDYDPVSGWQGWWRYFGFDSSRYAEPAYNVQLAYLIWQHSGWGPWQCMAVLE